MANNESQSRLGRTRLAWTIALPFLFVVNLSVIILFFWIDTHTDPGWKLPRIQVQWKPNYYPIMWVLVVPICLFLGIALIWRKRMLHFLALCSLATFVLMTSHWIASYFVEIDYAFLHIAAKPGEERGHGIWIRIDAGGVWLRLEDFLHDSPNNPSVPLAVNFGWGKPFDPGYPKLPMYTAVSWKSPAWLMSGGVAAMMANAWPGYSKIYANMFFLIFPLWLPVLFCLPFPILSFKRLRQERLSRRGHCPTCSYDLRAHKPGDKCPECGTPVVAKEARR